MKITKQDKEKRLSKKEIDLIRTIYETTAKSNSSIAREFNVLEGSIRYLVKKNNWKKTNELQDVFVAQKLIQQETILNKFKSEQKQEDFKIIKSIADKEGVELAQREIRVQKLKQEMMHNAYEVATKIFTQMNSLLGTKTNSERKIEDIVYQGIKTGENKRTLIEKDFTSHDLEKLFNMARPFLEADGFLHKPIIEIKNNIENNINNEPIDINQKISDIIDTMEIKNIANT